MSDFSVAIPVLTGDEGVTTIQQIYNASVNENYVLFYPHGGSCESMTLDGFTLTEDSNEWKCARNIADEGTVGSGTSLERILADEQESVVLTAIGAVNVNDLKVRRIGGVGFNNWFEIE